MEEEHVSILSLRLLRERPAGWSSAAMGAQGWWCLWVCLYQQVPGAFPPQSHQQRLLLKPAAGAQAVKL